MIVYKSVCTFNDERVSERNLEILRVSARNNYRDGVTGLLVSDDGLYVQALEGLPGAVKACFSRIKADKRHHDVELLIDQPSGRRQFPRWSMGLVDTLELAYVGDFHTKLHSALPADVLDALVLAGQEHGLVQRIY